jgi:hypothetical protein
MVLVSVCGLRAQAADRQWTIYLAQDKHLDYNWCGSTTEIELRMAALLEYFLAAAEKNETRWNLDGTLWDEVYHRHRGHAGGKRLRQAISKGQLGYAGNYAVLLWGILDTETAIRACYGAIPIEKSTGAPARTAIVMENPGLTWGIANILSECGFTFLGRGIYHLRAESYQGLRAPYPLFWWQAPNGKRLLTRWDRYQDTKSWGGYAEAYCLAAMAGEKWNAFEMQTYGDRNQQEVYRQRAQFILQTVQRYEAYGDNYPVSSILLLGTGWDNWTCSLDFSAFIKKFNAESAGNIRIVDARYADFFLAVEEEIRQQGLQLPTITGSYGICWEEWAAHLGGQTADFRLAERLLRSAEASLALEHMAGREDSKRRSLLKHGMTALLKYAEHDFGGVDRRRAALAAGARASEITQALDIAQSLGARRKKPAGPEFSEYQTVAPSFDWRGGRVVFDPSHGAVTSIVDAKGKVWLAPNTKPVLGEFKHTLYRSRATAKAVFPPALPEAGKVSLRHLLCRRGPQGIQVLAKYDKSGFQIESDWLFHTAHPWIDISYRLQGWSDAPQTVEFCFPFSLQNPTYWYDAPGALLRAGLQEAGGDDLPGANPELYAGVTFAAASSAERTVLLLTPDTFLLRFGKGDSQTPAMIRSMPMMNLTGNDWQFGQGGKTEWTYRYRLVLIDQKFNPLRSFQEAQQFTSPPFIQAPGQSPILPGLEALDIKFPAGPLLAFKVAEDQQRLMLRFWNVLNRPAQGSLQLPANWQAAEVCDALERPLTTLSVTDGAIKYSAGPLQILTIALKHSR